MAIPFPNTVLFNDDLSLLSCLTPNQWRRTNGWQQSRQSVTLHLFPLRSRMKLPVVKMATEGVCGDYLLSSGKPHCKDH